MKISKSLTVVAICLVTLSSGCQTTGRNSCCKQSAMTVGTFRRGDVVIAYYNSVVHAEYLKSIKQKHDEALAAGDQERADEIAGQASELQELAHRQLTQNAPLDNIMQRLKSQVESIRQENNVDSVVEESRASKNQKTVDVTDQILARLKSARKRS